MRLPRLCLTALSALLVPALAAQAATLAVVNKSDHTVDLLDPASGASRATLATGRGPHEAAMSPSGATLVVSNYGPRGDDGSSLTVIDVAAARVRAVLDLAPYRRPHGLAWIDERTLTVTFEASQALLVLELPSGRIVHAIATGKETSHMVALAQGGKRAFVASIGSGTVSVFDLASGSKLRDLATGAGAEGIATAPSGREVWVTNREADTLSVIDVETLAVVATIPCPGFPIRIAFTPDGQRALVSAARSGEVVAFDVAARRELARRKLDLSAVAEARQRLFGDRFGESPVPVGLLITPDGKRAFVAATQSDAVVEIDPLTLEARGLCRAGHEPDGMAWSEPGQP